GITQAAAFIPSHFASATPKSCRRLLEQRGSAGDSPAKLRIFGHVTVAAGGRVRRPRRACCLVPIDQRGCGLARDRLALAVPDRRTDRAVDQGQHGDAASALTTICEK